MIYLVIFYNAFQASWEIALVAGIQIDDGFCFSPSYREARQRILEAARHSGGSHRAYVNSNRGPTGEELATDAFWFGSPDAADVLVLVSATHGVEGFCGSAAQLDWLMCGGKSLLRDNQAALLIHALNPFGFAWLRRATEEGIDLNRNGIDFNQGLPDNPGYTALADAFVPRLLDEATIAAADDRIAKYRAEQGEVGFENARSGGQYRHPEGLFYGGTQQAWSTKTLQAIVNDYDLRSRRNVALIDYHTGLGPFGYGEPICGHKPGEIGQQRCRAWYGDSLGEPLLGKSSSLPIAGLSQYAWARAIGQPLTFIALEFGTYPLDLGVEALRGDHWLHAYGTVDWNSEETRRIKAALRHFYHPDTADWRQMVLMRSRQVFEQAIHGMAEGPLGQGAISNGK